MSCSGIKCDNSVKTEFDKMAVGSNKQYRYIIFKIQKEGDEYTKVVVDKTGDRSLTLEDMKSEFDEKTPRYAVFDLCYNTKKENRRQEKLVFLCFIPSDATLKDKMVYAGTKHEVKKKLGSASLALDKECDCLGDITLEEIVDDLARKGQ